MPMRPTAMAAPNAARPMCKFPLISSCSPSSWAPKTEQVNRSNLKSGALDGFLVLTNQQGEHCSQQHENQCLNYAHKQFHKVKRNRQQPSEFGDKRRHSVQHVLARKNIAVESKTQG